MTGFNLGLIRCSRRGVMPTGCCRAHGQGPDCQALHLQTRPAQAGLERHCTMCCRKLRWDQLLEWHLHTSSTRVWQDCVLCCLKGGLAADPSAASCSTQRCSMTYLQHQPSDLGFSTGCTAVARLTAQGLPQDASGVWSTKRRGSSAALDALRDSTVDLEVSPGESQPRSAGANAFMRRW